MLIERLRREEEQLIVLAKRMGIIINGLSIVNGQMLFVATDEIATNSVRMCLAMRIAKHMPGIQVVIDGHIYVR